MAKRSFRGKPKKKKAVGGGNGNMMSQMQAMQAAMRQQQEALAGEEYEVTAGGGAIKVTITGHQRIVGIEIDPDFVDTDDMEMLQDILTTTINQAIEQSQTVAAEKMEGLTGGLGLGDLLGGL